jgi:hypothetical protein
VWNGSIDRAPGDACYRMRDRFLAEEVWEILELSVDELSTTCETATSRIMFRSYPFTRIVPTLRYIGLWAQGSKNAFTDMGCPRLRQHRPRTVMAEDERTAEDLDALRHAGMEAVPTADTV